MLHLFAHNPHSEGAAELAQALGIRRIRHEGSRYVGNANKHVINWGPAVTSQKLWLGPTS